MKTALSFAATCAAAMLLSASALADGWSDWQQVDDNHRNQIFVRMRHNNFKFEGGGVEWYWQFRSEYAEPVRFDYSVTCTEGGKPPSTGTVTLAPGAESWSGGSWTICRSISVRVGRVRKP